MNWYRVGSRQSPTLEMSFKLFASRVLPLAALFVCAALLVDYLRTTPALCGFRSGCQAVIQSNYGRPLGVPLPLVGLCIFGVYFALAVYPSSVCRRLLGPLSIVIGLGGLFLASVQVLVLRQTCPFCLVVDAIAILLAAMELG